MSPPDTTRPGDDWSEPRLVDKTAPPALQLGEMAEIRRSWRVQRHQRYGRRLWPAFVVLLVVVIGVCVGLLAFGSPLRF